MTSLEIIRSKQRVNKATEDHAEAVRRQIEQEDTAKFAPLKKIYDEVKHLPSRHHNYCTQIEGNTHPLEAMWEADTSSRHITFRGDGGWRLAIEGGKFEKHNYSSSGTTEDAEVAKGWLVEKLATLLLDEKAN